MVVALSLMMSQPEIFVNQVGYDRLGSKWAVAALEQTLPSGALWQLVDEKGTVVAHGPLDKPERVNGWEPVRNFYQVNFSDVHRNGRYRLRVEGGDVLSPPFEIGDGLLPKQTLPAILNYYHKQRANTSQELAADAKLRVKGSTQTVDMHGGWCDASGDVSKYFSHLAYANFMSPQQTPLVVWSMASVREKIPSLLEKWKLRNKIESEALWGADYMVRALSSDGFFRAVVFSYFNPDPNAREVVGLHADSVTTDEVQASYRQGGGLAIAALARVSRWGRTGDYRPEQYLEAAEKAFEHLQKHNLEYDNDHRENIIDDYGALLGATELWITTGKEEYRDEARKRADHLNERMTPEGYFLADDGNRPFWHASDAGLPVVALTRYLDKETDPARRKAAISTIKLALDYNLRVTREVPNPFAYARQTFRIHGQIHEGFFIPHENETGWWWQGENARLASLATAALVGGRLVYPARTEWGVKPELAAFAERQLDWVLGENPYGMCFMYGFGVKNVPHMRSMFGHGSERGGISNGVTGHKDRPDGWGIDFRTSDEGNEWRWTEQWLPHSAWFLQAMGAMCLQSKMRRT